MKKFLTGFVMLALLTAAPVCAKEKCLNKFERKSEEIVKDFEKHLQKIRESENLTQEIKALLSKQAKETMNLKLRHLKEKTDLKRKQKQEIDAMRQSVASGANNPTIDEWYVEEQEIDVYALPQENTGSVSRQKTKNPNRHPASQL